MMRELRRQAISCCAPHLRALRPAFQGSETGDLELDERGRMSRNVTSTFALLGKRSISKVPLGLSLVVFRRSEPQFYTPLTLHGKKCKSRGHRCDITSLIHKLMPSNHLNLVLQSDVTPFSRNARHFETFWDMPF